MSRFAATLEDRAQIWDSLAERWEADGLGPKAEGARLNAAVLRDNWGPNQ